MTIIARAPTDTSAPHQQSKSLTWVVLEHLMLQRHVGLRLKTDTSTEDIGQSATLLSQCVDDGRSRWCQGSLVSVSLFIITGFKDTYLQHVAQNTENTMEALIILSTRSITISSFPSDSSHHLGNDHEVNDQRRREKRVFTDIEQADGLMSTHEDLGVIFIERPLVVSNSWHVFDDHAMVGMFTRLVKDMVCFNHIIHNIGLGNLLGAELLLGTQVHTIIVAEMVVAGDGAELDACIDHEVHQSRLHLGLSGFEIITANEGAMLLCQLNGPWYESILR